MKKRIFALLCAVMMFVTPSTGSFHDEAESFHLGHAHAEEVTTPTDVEPVGDPVETDVTTGDPEGTDVPAENAGAVMPAAETEQTETEHVCVAGSSYKSNGNGTHSVKCAECGEAMGDTAVQCDMLGGYTYVGNVESRHEVHCSVCGGTTATNECSPDYSKPVTDADGRSHRYYCKLCKALTEFGADCNTEGTPVSHGDGTHTLVCECGNQRDTVACVDKGDGYCACGYQMVTALSYPCECGEYLQNCSWQKLTVDGMEIHAYACPHQQYSESHTPNYQDLYSFGSQGHAYGCSTCNALYSQVVAHTGTISYGWAGDKHLTACTDCSTKSVSSAYETHTSGAEKIPYSDEAHASKCTVCGGPVASTAENHVKGDEVDSNWDGTHSYKCSVCHTILEGEAAEACNFVFGGDEYQHGNMCTKCGYIQNGENHSTEKGYTQGENEHYLICDACGEAYNHGVHAFDYVGAGDSLHHVYRCMFCHYSETGNERHVDDDSNNECDVCKSWVPDCLECDDYASSQEWKKQTIDGVEMHVLACPHGKYEQSHAASYTNDNNSVSAGAAGHFRVCDHSCGLYSAEAVSHSGNAWGKAADAADTHQIICGSCNATDKTPVEACVANENYWTNTEDSHHRECAECYMPMESTMEKCATESNYINNGDGTHTWCCDECGEAFVAEHDTTNGACVCGYQEVTYPCECGESVQNLSWKKATGADGAEIHVYACPHGVIVQEHAPDYSECSWSWSGMSAGEAGHYPRCKNCGELYSDELMAHEDYVYLYGNGTNHAYKCNSCTTGSLTQGMTPCVAGTQYMSGQNGTHTQVCQTCEWDMPGTVEECTPGGNGYAAFIDGGHGVKCTKCNGPAGEKLDHNWNDFSNVGEDGHMVVCSDCNALNWEAGTIPHTASEDYKSDEYEHWKYCTECGGRIESTNETHELDSGTAKPENKYMHVVACSVCGREASERCWEYQNTVYQSIGDTMRHKKTSICSKCGNVVEELAGHSMDGCGDVACSVCGQTGVTVWKDFVEHTLGEWQVNGNKHFRVCTTCGKTLYEGEHGRGCTEEVCDTCGVAYTGEENVWHNTEFERFNNTEGHWYRHTCLDCGNVQENCYEHTVPCDSTDGICSECGGYYPEAKAKHTYNWGEALYDETKHWYICTVCEEVCNEGPHDYDCGSCYECFVEAPAGVDPDHVGFCGYDFDEDKHWGYCDMCMDFVLEGPHSFGEDGLCVCGYKKVVNPEESEEPEVTPGPGESEEPEVTPAACECGEELQNLAWREMVIDGETVHVYGCPHGQFNGDPHAADFKVCYSFGDAGHAYMCAECDLFTDPVAHDSETLSYGRTDAEHFRICVECSDHVVDGKGGAHNPTGPIKSTGDGAHATSCTICEMPLDYIDRTNCYDHDGNGKCDVCDYAFKSVPECPDCGNSPEMDQRKITIDGEEYHAWSCPHGVYYHMDSLHAAEYTQYTTFGDEGHALTCAKCFLYGEVVSHEGETSFAGTGEWHVQICEVCAQYVNDDKVEPHTWGGPITSTGNGRHAQSCLGCGFPKDDETVPCTDRGDGHCECGYTFTSVLECPDCGSSPEMDQRKIVIDGEEYHAWSCPHGVYYHMDSLHAPEYDGFMSLHMNGHAPVCSKCHLYGDAVAHNNPVYAGNGEWHVLVCEDCMSNIALEQVEAHTPGGAPRPIGDGRHAESCTVCNFPLAGKEETCTPGEKYESHDDGTHSRRCEVCDYQVGEPENCEYTEGGNNYKHGDWCAKCDYVHNGEWHQVMEFEYNEDGHWGQCLTCGMICEAETHYIELRNDRDDRRYHVLGCWCGYKTGESELHVDADSDNVCDICGENMPFCMECENTNEGGMMISKIVDGVEIHAWGCVHGKYDPNDVHEPEYNDFSVSGGAAGHYKGCAHCSLVSTELLPHVGETWYQSEDGFHILTCDECWMGNNNPHMEPCKANTRGHYSCFGDGTHGVACETCWSPLESTRENCTPGEGYSQWNDEYHGQKCTICEGPAGELSPHREGGYSNWNDNEGHVAACPDCGAPTEGWDEITIIPHVWDGYYADEWDHIAACSLCGAVNWDADWERHIMDPATVKAGEDIYTHVGECIVCRREFSQRCKEIGDFSESYQAIAGDKDHHMTEFTCNLCGNVTNSKTVHVSDDCASRDCGQCGEKDVFLLNHYEGHVYSDWINGGDYCYSECEECGVRLVEREHEREHDANVCKWCGAAYTGENVNHDLFWSEYFDEEGHWDHIQCQLCDYEELNFWQEHRLDCNDADGLCWCGYPAKENAQSNHGYDMNEVECDDQYHWVNCLDCGELIKELHDWRCGRCSFCDMLVPDDVVTDHHYTEYFWNEEMHWGYCYDCMLLVDKTAHKFEASGECRCGAKLEDFATATPEVTPEPTPEVTPAPTPVVTPEPTVKPTRVPHAHTPVSEEILPTCTETGLLITSCATCGAVIREEVIPMTAHAYGTYAYIGNGTHSAKCACGDVLTASCSLSDVDLGTMICTSCAVCGNASYEIKMAELTIEVEAETKVVEEAVIEIVLEETEGEMSEETTPVVPEGVTLMVNETVFETPVEILPELEVKVEKIYNIALVLEGEKIEPKGSLKVSIPMTEEDITAMEGKTLMMLTEDGELVEVVWEIIDGKLVFVTDVLGMFVLTDKPVTE